MSIKKIKEVFSNRILKAKTDKVKRKLGLLEGKVKFVFALDFKMTENEFING